MDTFSEVPGEIPQSWLNSVAGLPFRQKLRSRPYGDVCIPGITGAYIVELGEQASKAMMPEQGEGPTPDVEVENNG